MKKWLRPTLAISAVILVVAMSFYYPYGKEQALARADETRLARVDEYAEVLAKAIHTTEGDRVVINADVSQAEFATLVAEKCYQQGAKGVKLMYSQADMANLYAKYLCDDEYDGYYYDFVVYSYMQNTMPESKFITILSHNFDDNELTPEEFNKFSESVDDKITSIMEKHDLVAEGETTSMENEWVLAGYPTTSWAKKIYPELNEQAAYNKLLDDFLDFARIGNDEDFFEHADKLTALAKKANDLGITELHYKSKTADLHVPLHPSSRFEGGVITTSDGDTFSPNVPTEEIFTMPTKYGATGTVEATRPFTIMKQQVEGLKMTFEGGKLVDYSATAGGDAFKKLVDKSPDGIYLGESALVASDSPIFQSENIYYDMLFDENSGAHIALGDAYEEYNLNSGAAVDSNVNDADYHIDITIGSEDLTVTGTLKDGSKIDLIKNGKWAI